MNAVKNPGRAGGCAAVPQSCSVSDKTVNLLESVFSDYAGFKKSDVLKRKIKRVLDGKSDDEILGWINQMIKSKQNDDLAALSEDLTNNETFFFRDFLQYECLQQHILPKLLEIKRKKNDKVFRLWSAACSTGEEAYSLAIITLEFMVQEKLAKITENGRVLFLDGWALKVCGTDISGHVVRLAQHGAYSTAGLSPFRSFPKQYYPYFEKQHSKDRLYSGECDIFRVNEGIRNLLYFERHNLNSDSLPLFLKNMDVVFCRNLLIYIEPVVQKVMQKKFAEALASKGFLVMSVVDKLHDPKPFIDLNLGGNIVYQRR